MLNMIACVLQGSVLVMFGVSCTIRSGGNDPIEAFSSALFALLIAAGTALIWAIGVVNYARNKKHYVYEWMVIAGSFGNMVYNVNSIHCQGTGGFGGPLCFGYYIESQHLIALMCIMMVISSTFVQSIVSALIYSG